MRLVSAFLAGPCLVKHVILRDSQKCTRHLGHMQEENWGVPARQAAASAGAAPADVEDSRGHGNTQVPHEV